MKRSNSWAKPLLVQLLLCLVIIIVTYVIDKHIDGRGINHLLSNIFAVDPGILANVLGGLTQVAPAILGITVTVIAIIVEMASNKYSPKVMDLFVGDRRNFWAMALFVIASVNSIWVAHIVTPEFFPFVSIIVNALLVVTSLLLVIPYFSHIFNFLHPNNFIAYVEAQTTASFEELAKIKVKNEVSDELRANVTEKIDFIGDIAINSALQGDRAVSQYCSNILTDIMKQYLIIKPTLPEYFFKLSEHDLEDPDFIDFSNFVINKIQERRVWTERKIFRLFEIMFTISRENLKTVASGILLNTVKIGELASEQSQKEVIFTVVQYFNSFLRLSINNQDPRTAFNIMEHYRDFGEILIKNIPEEVVSVVFYFKYYALEAQKRHVLFILETAAHDICRLVEVAYEMDRPIYKDILEIFLKLDQPIEDSSKEDISQLELSLIGVRIAQVKLAAFFIMKNREDLARLIYEDMRVEPISRIHKIHELIDMTPNEEYWEITGRGVNFFFVSPERHVAMHAFFSWFDEVHK